MTMAGKIVTIFGSSQPAEEDQEYRFAYEVGKFLAKAGFVVCNGGYGGSMEASARGAKEAGGSTIGVTFQNSFKKSANRWIDKEIFQPSLVERMMKLIQLGDAYVILKGGTGTLLELAAVWEFINKGLLKEKPILLVGDFWNEVVRTLQAESLQESKRDCTRFIKSAGSPEECAELLKIKMIQSF
jgi:uncharacterized protein (TIGR00730 family)